MLTETHSQAQRLALLRGLRADLSDQVRRHPKWSRDYKRAAELLPRLETEIAAAEGVK